MTKATEDTNSDDTLDRVLASADKRTQVRVFGDAQALQDASTAGHADSDGDQWDLADRHAGIQRRIRILKDDLHILAQPLQIPALSLCEIKKQ